MRPAIAIGGSLAQKPGAGGHAWVFLQYLLGFRQLGWDVLFIDRLEPDMCRDECGRPCRVEDSMNLRYLRGVMETFGLGDSFALLFDRGRKVIGRSRAQLLAQARRSALLFNVMGFIDDEDILAAFPRRAFLDIDPGFGQMWRELGLHDPFTGHDDFVTIGQNIGRAGCPVPTCGLQWVTTSPPVVLSEWPADAPIEHRDVFTTVASWRGAYGPIEFQGRIYGPRAHEFRRYFALPRLTGRRFELALNIDAGDERDRAALAANGWALVDPRIVAALPAGYRAYIQASLGELMIAKGMYAQTRCGWLSDRSVCYLASGRPVVAQDTGVRDLYPTGEGLLVFATPEEAAAGIEDVCAHYEAHAVAARALAVECFDSDRVLSTLLARLGVS